MKRLLAIPARRNLKPNMHGFLSLRKPRPLRIVVGAGGVFDPGWIPTEVEFLNLLKPGDWAKYFRPNLIDAILAEHVWEHLAPVQGIKAAALCYQYLRPGGYLRVAVPDGLHPEPNYIQRVRPGGTGQGAEDHKVLYDYQTLRRVFQPVGFKVKLLEYFDHQGVFHFIHWNHFDGMIRRSSRFDSRNANHHLAYTSLILDCEK
jgi:predicted SAM-dependent methyltransferase